MLFRDLYRFRVEAEGKDAREAWLSACLTELLDQDRPLLDAFLKEVGDVGPIGPEAFVEHQRRFGPVGDSQIADLWIEGEGAVLVECKDHAEPDLAQMEGYRDRAPDGTRIVLVAGEQAIRELQLDPEWRPYGKVSWQRLYDLARSSPDIGAVQSWLRRAFRELLEWAELAPVGDVSPRDVLAMLDHWGSLEDRQRELKDGVAALLPAKAGVGDGHWQVDGTSAWWSVSRRHAELPLRGLALQAEPMPNGAFDWSVELRPVGNSRRVLSEAGLSDIGFDGWWGAHLFRGRRVGVWSEELAEAVAQARAVLREIGVKPGRRKVEPDALPVSAVSGDVALRRTNHRIWSAGRVLRNEIAERIGGRSGRRYAVVQHQGREVGWFWTDTSEAGLFSVRLGWWKEATPRSTP